MALNRVEFAEAGVESSEAETRQPQAAPQRITSWRAVAAASAAALLCGTAGYGGARMLLRGRDRSVQTRGHFQRKVQTLAMPGRESCAAVDEDCFSVGCCSISGYRCFETTTGMGKCMKNCTPSATKSCVQAQGIMDPVLADAEWYGPSLYCFSVAMQDTGTTKPYFQLELLQTQYEKGIGIFGCEAYGAFSDLDGELAPGVPITKVPDTDGDFHFAKRKEVGTWINTGLHASAWKAIMAAGEYKSVSWVVKVDTDAVFVPSRLASFLSVQLVPATGIYLENCKYVQYGYFGSLEVFSTAAFDTLLANIDSCKATLDWKTGVSDGKFGPMGEDLFAQVCLDSLGVPRGEAFGSKTDGCCEADRPEEHKKNKKWVPTCTEANTPAYHPLKTVEEYTKCYYDTTAMFGF